MTPEQRADVLSAPTDEHGTVREYLTDLLVALWLDGADSKYGMTGESDWRYDLYRPLARLGLIPPWREGYGIEYPPEGMGPRDPGRRRRADELIVEVIRAMGADR
jgi:hypothetical protein